MEFRPTNNLESSLYKYFGFCQFRPLQKDIIQAIIDGRDTLAILPTGAGKSLCFQLPAVLLPGTTIVISPLISLMKDQVEHCLAKQIPAGYLSSTQSKQTQHETLELFRLRKLKLLYVSPERLKSIRFQLACQRVDINLIVIDEAHCISNWGHDFRPEYRQIIDFIHSRPQRPTVAAFTASATPQTQSDIVASLQLKQPERFFSTFRRPNLHFFVTPTHDHFHKTLYTLRLLKQAGNQHAIIYAATRANTEFIAQLIQNLLPQITIAAYHAGLVKSDREQVQTLFQHGKIQIIVATSAFGMGVDKADVRQVIHFQLPPSLEDYYQEAGRAGRDGQPADCFLFANQNDVTIHQEMIAGSSNKPNQHRSERKLQSLLNYCNQNHHCRQVIISQYFGERLTEPCGVCDVCQNSCRHADSNESSRHSEFACRHCGLDPQSQTRPDRHAVPTKSGSASSKESPGAKTANNQLTHPLLTFASQRELQQISCLLKLKTLLSLQKPPPPWPLLTDRIICQIALLPPTDQNSWLKIAGIGTGWWKQWQLTQPSSTIPESTAGLEQKKTL